MQHTTRRVSALLTCALVISACSRVDSPQPGTYRGTAETGGGAAPLLIDVVLENEQPVLFVTKGGERHRLQNVSVAAGKLTARLPDSSAELQVELFRDRLRGHLIAYAAKERHELDFEAKRGESYLFYDESQTDNADVSGYWELTATHADDTRLEALLQLRQEHDRVAGTMALPSNERYNVDGQVHGDDVRLVSLAGDTIELYALRVTEHGTLEGEYWRGKDESGEITARRATDAVEAGY